MTQILLLFGVAVLVALNGLFVAAEFALVRASQGRIEQLRDEGRRGAALVLKQIERIDEYLSACQLGITMTSLGIGFLGEPAIAKQFDNGDFKGSVDFVNRLTPAAEEMNHHPDLEISWKTVTVTITTHSEGGLTEGDFELARRIDALG